MLRPGGNNVSAFVDQTPPEWGKNPRPVIKAKVNEPIRINYLLTNVYPHKTLENVVVHFFIARQKKVGQKELPDLKGDVVMETAFDMDFKPGSKAGQRSTIKIDAPGRLSDPHRDAEHAERSRAFRGDRPGRGRGEQAVSSPALSVSDRAATAENSQVSAMPACVGIPRPIDSRRRTRRADRKAGVVGRGFAGRDRGDKGGLIVASVRDVRR